ncbi:MAG TPA: hypothetical protein VEA99_18900, partial [Gemmatimonadaceae bacterium]|nr:hypothetical protein [Gemmatimonadaceae bacterium]
VFTEVLQAALKTVACVWVAVVAIQAVDPEMIRAAVPAGWHSPWFGRRLELDWSGIMPAANTRILQDGWTIFSAFFMMTLFKGVLLSGAGPAPNYDMQRVLSTKTPSDAARMSGLVTVVLMVWRYMLIAGITVLALVFFRQNLVAMGDKVDFEQILPLAMQFLPSGLLGLLIAALLAAFMATYSATVNAAPAYIVNDIYKRYMNPNADQKVLVRMSYITSVAVVVVGTAIGLFVATLNDIVQWIVSALYGGYAAANVLKWYWWRFNAYGYFWGMVGGIAGSVIVPVVMPGVSPIFAFPVILAVSVAGCFIGSLATKPDDEAVLKEFYRRVRPWGFWGPIHAAVVRDHPETRRNTAFGRDMFNVVVGIAWQTAQVAMGIYVVLQDWRAVGVCAVIVAATTVVLKFNWYDKLEDYPADYQPPDPHAVAPDAPHLGLAEVQPTAATGAGAGVSR